METSVWILLVHFLLFSSEGKLFLFLFLIFFIYLLLHTVLLYILNWSVILCGSGTQLRHVKKLTLKSDQQIVQELDERSEDVCSKVH